MLNPDFRDILSCLNEEGVEFLVVGAYALAAHGFVRATGDIDIWVRSTPANAKKVLTRFGSPLTNISDQDFTRTDVVVQLGVEPCRVDLITSVDGLEFDAAWRSRVNVVVDGLEIAIPSKTDLLKNKTATNRDKDQGDIAWLRKNQ